MTLKRRLGDLAQQAKTRGVPEIDVPELNGMIDAGGDRGQPPLVIDVREPAERAGGHIPGSVGIPRGVLERDIEKAAFGGSVSEADLDRPVVCYCGGGSRSLLACDSLRQMGFTRVHSLAGGFKAWSDAGQPVTRER